MPSGVYARKKKPCKNHVDREPVSRGLCEECLREQTRKYHLSQIYSVSLEEYQQLHDHQQGLCEICKQPETAVNRHGVVRFLCVDHDHRTGRVRSLLCASCNIGLGNFKDDISILKAALEYLIEQQEKGL